VTSVDTMGYPGGTGRVTLYRLKVSTDCVSFYLLLDGNGNNAVLSYYNEIIIDAPLY